MVKAINGDKTLKPYNLSYTEQVNGVYIYAVQGTRKLLAHLAQQASGWLDLLGLTGKILHLSAIDRTYDGVYHAASFTLLREDGSILDLEVLPGPQWVADPQWIREVRSKKFRLIEIVLEAHSYKAVKKMFGSDCTDKHCEGAPKHTEGEHSVLHELVHVAYPDFVSDNEWTDAKVAELLSEWRE